MEVSIYLLLMVARGKAQAAARIQSDASSPIYVLLSLMSKDDGLRIMSIGLSNNLYQKKGIGMGMGIWDMQHL